MYTGTQVYRTCSRSSVREAPTFLHRHAHIHIYRHAIHIYRLIHIYRHAGPL
jgi:hypothetical protein